MPGITGSTSLSGLRALLCTLALTALAVSSGCSERAASASASADSSSSTDSNSSALYVAQSPLPEVWEATGVMAVNREFHEAVSLGATGVLVCGGRQSLADITTYHDACELFDPATREFRAVAPLPAPSEAFSLISVAPGHAIALGGSQGVVPAYSGDVWSFRVASGPGAWDAETALVGARRQLRSAWLPAANAVAVVGGFDGGVLLDDLVGKTLGDGSLGTWQTVRPSSARIGHTATVLASGSDLLVIGGGEPSGPVKSSARLLSVASSGTAAWTELESLPAPLVDHSATLDPVSGRVYVVGGRRSATAYTADGGYYVATNGGSFTPIAAMSRARHSHAAAWLGGKLIVTGGISSNIRITATVEFFDPALGRWFPLDSMLVPRRNHTITVLDERRLLVTGGTATEAGQATSSAEVLTPRLLAEPCDGTRNECLTGHCVDGVCCAEACDGSCQRCDATGTCRTDVSGEPLGERSCAGGLVCDDGSCLTRCARNEDCMSDRYCENEQCVPRKDVRAECSSQRECVGDVPCVDGYCCDSSCEGRCESCGEPGSVGTCVPTPKDQAPRGEREACAEPGDACGLSCNGEDRKSCHYRSADAACGQARCVDGNVETPSTCDGHGNCLDTSMDCGVFGCNGENCRTSCQKDSDCFDERFTCNVETAICVLRRGVGDDCKESAECLDGLTCHSRDLVCCESQCPDESWSCRIEGHFGDCRKVLGAECESKAQCGSGFCVDGVCCDTACTGQCEECNGETLGKCSPRRGPPAPRREPCASSAELCSELGCDGIDDARSRNSCRAYVNLGVECGAATCSDNGFIAESACASDGTCRAPRRLACGAYQCTPDGCGTKCVGDQECSEGFQCQNGACAPPAARCEGDILVLADDTRQDCKGYRCVANACLERCSSSSQCVKGFVCDDLSHACVDTAVASDDSSCSCSAPGRSSRTGPGFGLTLISSLALLALRRRRGISARSLARAR